MPHEVIMPALGMAQDTGVIVLWRKQAGEAVAAGDVLMEVETDKAVVEVEAGADGFVAELRAEAGEPVPVGDVVALITPDKPDGAPPQKPPVPAETVAATKAQDEEMAEKEEPELKAAAAKPPSSPQTPVASPAEAQNASRGTEISPPDGGRILASPKAKRLAAERGLDLRHLLATGHLQPYHVADLDRLPASPGHAQGSGLAHDHIEARVSGAAYAELLTWLEAETGRPAESLAVLAAFAAASLRTAGGECQEVLLVAAERPGAERVFYADPDFHGLTLIEAAGGGTPDLVLRDLTQSRITAMRLSSDAAPVLTLANDESGFTLLALDFASGALDAETAIELIGGMAARLEEPLRHLL